MTEMRERDERETRECSFRPKMSTRPRTKRRFQDDLEKIKEHAYARPESSEARIAELRAHCSASPVGRMRRNRPKTT